MQITKGLALQVLDSLTLDSTILDVEQRPVYVQGNKAYKSTLVAHRPTGKIVYDCNLEGKIIPEWQLRERTIVSMITNLGRMLQYFKVNIKHEDGMVKLSCFTKESCEADIHLKNVKPHIVIDIHETGVAFRYRTAYTEYFGSTFETAVTDMTRIHNRVVNHLRGR